MLTLEEKQFVLWALEYLVPEDTVNINPEGRFFFRKRFFVEMHRQEQYLTTFAKNQLDQLSRKFLQT